MSTDNTIVFPKFERTFEEVYNSSDELLENITEWNNALIKAVQEFLGDNRELWIAMSQIKILQRLGLGQTEKQCHKILFNSDAQTYEVIKWIRKNEWEKKVWDNRNIYTSDFKNICKLIIPFPFNFTGFISGEYILNLVLAQNSDHKNVVDLKWHCEGTKDSISHKKGVKFFDADNSYLHQFEKKLHVSFENFDSKNKKSAILHNLCEYYAYSTEEFNVSLGATTNLLKIFEKPYNFLMCKVDKNNTIPFEFIDDFKGLILFETMLFQSLNTEQQNEMIAFYGNIKSVVNALLIFVSDVVVNLKNIADWHNINSREKLAHMHKQEKFLGQKIKELSKYTKYNNDVKKDAIEIQLTEENMFKIILYRLTRCNFLAINKTIENTFSLISKVHKKHGKIFSYKKLKNNEKIEVDNWQDFKQKYESCLTELFPEIKKLDELQAHWQTAITVIFNIFLKLSGSEFFVYEKNFSNFSKKYSADIRKVNAKDLFSLMCFLHQWGYTPVEMSGKNTKFYNAVMTEFKKPSRKKIFTLDDVLRKLKTHFCSPQRPYFYEVLLLQIIWWQFEQTNSFLLSPKIQKLIREFISITFENCVYILNCGDFNESFTKFQEMFDWYRKLLEDYLKFKN